MSQQIIDSLSGNGISTADKYFRSVEMCFDGGFCPIKMFPEAPQGSWENMIKEAESRLVYSAADMAVEEFRKEGPAGLSAGAVADLDIIVTSTRKDRDGDILETAGAKLDPKAPLLFHHIPMEPIGKLVTELGRNSTQLRAKVAIIDTETGRDAAQLVEFGALRISHGFRPLKFKPLKDNGEGMMPGWHITEYEIMEVSLVTVPSNVDAVITAFSRGKLHSPLIKGMAEHEFRGRPVQGVGFSHTQSLPGGHEMSWSAPSVGELRKAIDMTLEVKGEPGTPVMPSQPIQPVHPVPPGGGTLPPAKPSHQPGSAGKESLIDYHRDLETFFKENTLTARDYRAAILSKSCACDIKDFTGTTGETDKHVHSVNLDDDGNGKTATVSGHSHDVVEFEVMEADGHSHELTKDNLDEKAFRKSGAMWRKTFDVAQQHVEAAALEYDWISRYCSCEVKQLVNMGTFSSRIKMGSFLTGLKHALFDSTEVDARRLTGRGLETPLGYETIQLNSRNSDHFLVDGLSFRKLGSKLCFVVKFERHWNGESVDLFCSESDAAEIDGILGDAWKWAAENNFLKGEAFSLSGEFLPSSGEKWGDLFLDKENEIEVRRTVDLINKHGKHCPNRGQIFMGPPGTGKTLSGRLIRNHADATFIWIAGKDAYYFGGVGAILQAFEMAKELAPSIIFMEDIDASLNSQQAIDVLKTEMDGIGRSAGVITVLTTNHPEVFPEALVDRPGRFHDVLKFSLPGKDIRHSMIGKWLPDLGDKNRLKAVDSTDGYSGAHVFELCAYAINLQEADELGIDDAVSKAISKIHDQRELIDQEVLGGRMAAGRRRADVAMTKLCGRTATMHSKRISVKNKALLEDAIDELTDAVKVADTPRATKALIRSAKGSVSVFLKSQSTEEEGKSPAEKDAEGILVMLGVDTKLEASKTIEQQIIRDMSSDQDRLIKLLEMVDDMVRVNEDEIREREASEMLELLEM